MGLQSVFAILGMQLFMGTLASCSDPAILTAAECNNDAALAPPAAASAAAAAASAAAAATVSVPAAAGRALRGGGGGPVEYDEGTPLVWANPRIGSFDDFGSAMRLLYVQASGDEWEAPMWMTMAATTPGHAPVRDDYSPAAFYSIAWMFIGSFFALNLFVGVICDSFDPEPRTHDAQIPAHSVPSAQCSVCRARFDSSDCVVRAAGSTGSRRRRTAAAPR